MARTVTILLSISISCLVPTLTGCHQHDGAAMEAAVTQYDNGAISLAKIKAQKVYEQGGPQTSEAAWLIGLCDYRHGRTTAARAAFELASASPDPELSARAKAMIGQTLLEDGQPAAAAVQFEHAWPELTGDDRSRCATHAATAWSQAGRDDLATQWIARSTQPATPPARNVVANHSIQTIPLTSDGPFTLQAGAYKKVDGARRAQEQLSEPRHEPESGRPASEPGRIDMVEPCTSSTSDPSKPDSRRSRHRELLASRMSWWSPSTLQAKNEPGLPAKRRPG